MKNTIVNLTRTDAMEKLKSEAFVDITNKSLLEKAEKFPSSKFIGIIKNSCSLDNVKIAQEFAAPNSYYGHRYGANITAIWDIRPEYGFDLYCTDNDGILKNSIGDEDAIKRIKDARNHGKRVYYLFGGSTMMSMGARTPEFSIPALVEKITKQKYGEDVVCINFGLGGTYCKDSFNLLISEVIPNYGNPNGVIFYDGWNCASYISLMKAMSSELSNLKIKNQQGLRQLEHDFALTNLYDVKWVLIHAIKVLIASIFSKIKNISKNKFIDRVLNGIQIRLFDLRHTTELWSIVDRAFIKECSVIEELADETVREYAYLHENVRIICEARNIKFMFFLQPLVLWGNKPLTEKEDQWRKDGNSSGNTIIFKPFYKKLKLFLEASERKNLKSVFYDLTNVFDNVREQVYIDSGHLNRYGNLLVSEKIAAIIKSTKKDENI
jgi:hypothetical protein